MSAEHHWLDVVLSTQERSLRALDLRVRDVVRTGERVAKHAREVAAAHEDAGEQRAARKEVDHQRVVALVRAQRFGELTLRETRYASTLFDVFTPGELLTLLRSRPLGWRHLMTRCMREWERFCAIGGRSGYAPMFAEAPVGAFRVEVGMSAAALLGEGGVAVFGQALHEVSDGRVLVEFLNRSRLSWRWELTAYVVQQWVLHRRWAAGWSETLSIVFGTEEVRCALLPAKVGDVASRVRSTLKVHSNIVATLLEDGIKGALLPRPAFDKVIAYLLESRFGDPRVPPMSEAWQSVRERKPKAFAALLQLLVRDDLRFFFNIVQGNRERLEFWEEYLPTLQATLCVLDPAAYERVESPLRATANPALTGALSRVKRASGGGARVQAFCLFFMDIVVVEFSETGHAAYVYPRGVFEQRILPAVHAGVTSTTELKQDSWVDWRIRHQSGWQERTRWEIRSREQDARRRRG